MSASPRGRVLRREAVLQLVSRWVVVVATERWSNVGSATATSPVARPRITCGLQFGLQACRSRAHCSRRQTSATSVALESSEGAMFPADHVGARPLARDCFRQGDAGDHSNHHDSAQIQRPTTLGQWRLRVRPHCAVPVGANESPASNATPARVTRFQPGDRLACCYWTGRPTDRRRNAIN